MAEEQVLDHLTMDQLLEKHKANCTASTPEKPDGKVQPLDDLAGCAETAERFSEMCKLVSAIIELKKGPGMKVAQLDVEQRNRLSVAYKNVVGTRRNSWRVIAQSLNPNEHGTPIQEDDPLHSIAQNYQRIIEYELESKCEEVLSLIKNNLLPPEDDLNAMIAECKAHTKANKAPVQDKPGQKETAIFYLKMCGDYYRYLAEFKDTKKVKDAAEKHYTDAITIAEATLKPTHPTRLGLLLNASVCMYEILKKPTAAQTLAKRGFDEAIQQLDSLSDTTYKDSTLIMQLLRDNLTIWTSNTDGNENTRED